ncbi:MAG TPA: protein kinase, partial [Streptosporangiaceae bacterium]
MPDLVVGMEVGGCRLEQVIGRGGMGIVYRGRDLQLDRPVAVKLVASEHSSDAGVRSRFEREARLMAAIDHPNVIPVYGAGEQDGHLYLVMRYVDGTDLRR